MFTLLYLTTYHTIRKNAMNLSIDEMRKLVNSLDADTKYKFGQMFILKGNMRSYWKVELARDDSKYTLH